MVPESKKQTASRRRLPGLITAISDHVLTLHKYLD